VGDRFVFSFGLAAPLFVAHNRLSYRFKLEGWDNDWRILRGTEIASYRDLPAGRYRLRAQMTQGPGWSARELAAAVELRPHLHRRPSFLAACAALAGLLFFAIHRWRLARIAAHHRLIREERVRIARELHDSVGQTFASLGFHLSALARVIEGPQPRARAILDRVVTVLQHGRADVRETIGTLRAVETGLPAVDVTLARVVDEVRATLPKNGPALVLRSAPGPYRLDATARDELPRIAREAITNAVRHARAGVIEVVLEHDGGGTRLVVRDDGRGLDEDLDTLAARGHFGIAGMQERALRADATLSLRRRPDPERGTEVTLLVPAGEPAEAGGSAP
jgi:signal transduction histidine kinase